LKEVIIAMALSQIPDRLKKNSAVSFLRNFLSEFLSTRELLPLTTDDICRVCPLNRLGENGRTPDESAVEKIDRCRKRYFATLLQSYLGKPGDEETDWLYSHLKKCEACYLRRFTGNDVPVSFITANEYSELSDQHYLSSVSRRAESGE
jgi:hypothetical protein